MNNMPKIMFKKVLIANRGEIALRIIRSCKEMGIKTVAVYSTADRESLHVSFADEAVCIGAPQSNKSYLNIPAIISAAELTNTDAIHPGYGFLAENAKFARICAEHDIKFIGPNAEMIEKMGDKATAKRTMKQAGVPTIPGSEGLVSNISEGLILAAEIGYPVILKATAGGGGKGMRIVNDEKQFEIAWDSAKLEAQTAFGNAGLYLEKFVENPRHIEIQVAGDQYGNACHYSERDCSVQRRHQKLVEESPSPFMTDELRQRMGEAAIKAVNAIKYESLGTVEFLVDDQHNFYFMEMNTRIQVEHPITEEVVFLDLVKEQLKIAAGGRLEPVNHYPQRHAIECRINAENPFADFRPSPGRITTLHTPGGYGVRVDSHVYSSYMIPPYYDSMIAKLICVAATREEAISKMARALDEFIIEGIKTTIPFHQQLMQNKDFKEGNYTTKFMNTFKLIE